MKMNNLNTKITNPVVLFDGICNLCTHSVRFILTYNRKENIHFASLQSEFTHSLLKNFNLPISNINTVIFVDKDKIYTKSSAVFQIAKHLIYPWKTFYYLKFIPKNITDWIYDFIAKNRYSWFGKKDSCILPKPEWKHRFHN